MIQRPGFHRLLLCLFVGTGTTTCTFERRPESDGASGRPEVSLPATESEDLTRIDEVVQTTIASFRESVAAGDLSLALSQLDEEATLVDPLAGQAGEAASMGELLLELRSRHAEGSVYEPIGSEVLLATEDFALVVSRLSLREKAEDGTSEEIGTVLETTYLVRSSEGWRIRYLHRSRLDEP